MVIRKSDKNDKAIIKELDEKAFIFLCLRIKCLFMKLFMSLARVLNQCVVMWTVNLINVSIFFFIGDLCSV